MSADPQLLPPTETSLQVRPLPAELLNRFDAFIIAAEAKVKASEESLQTARGLIVDSEAAFILADTLMAAAKKTTKANDEERLELTRPIDDFKNQFLEADRPARDNYTAMIEICSEKMAEYRLIRRREREKAQLEAGRIIREQKERQEAEARKLEAKAASLKTPSRADALMREADEIRQAAAMMPESVALAASAPATAASSVSEPWIVEGFPDEKAFRHWLADHPEWWAICPLKTDTRPMNRFADQCHVLEIPGVKFRQKDVFRSKSR